jgi:hypothetical protein
MIKKTEDFGLYAGKVWTALNSYGSLTQTNLMKKTMLKEDEFYAAIGWLARENKIYKEGIEYRLGETNLTDKIGSDAYKVWNVLNKCGNIDINYIPRIAEIPQSDTYLALGWLAKEGKIKSKKIKPKKSQLYFGLK